MPLLEVDELRVTYRLRRDRTLPAVRGVSFYVEAGENLGLVGESGCGKSTLGNALLGLVGMASGRVRFEGRDVSTLRGAALQQFRRRAQMIFQDPYGSLDARMTIGSMLNEVLMVHRLGDRAERKARVVELLRLVGLDAFYAERYPHELSGGQRQRVGIARALAVKPDFIIADEPVSALDVSVQVQILNLMKDLQQEMRLAYLFIAHDLAVVKYMCERVLVMYLGRIVEAAPADALFARPAHPYTEALLSAVPDIGRGLRARSGGAARIVLKGDVPSATLEIAGCPFHPRCRYARELCRTQFPPWREVAPGPACTPIYRGGTAGRHSSLCHFADDLVAGTLVPARDSVA